MSQSGSRQLDSGAIDVGPLFRPLQVKTLRLENRVVMAPMTRSFAPDGVLAPEMTDYYRRRAEGGTGLIVTEGTVIDHSVAHFTSKVPHFYGEKALARWADVVTAVHNAGAKIVPQLWHTGLGRMSDQTANPDELSVAPSVVGKGALRAMEQKDIDDVIDAFARGAVTAKVLGFDGVAIHGAHGYLVDQFFWPRTNRRGDAYGGSLPNRLRFGVELLQEMRRRVGPDFPIMFRFSQWKATLYDARLAETPEELAALLQPLADAGVDIFDASTRRFWVPEFPGSDLNLAGWTKKLTGKVTMAVGSVGLQSPLDVAARLEAPDDTGVTTDNLIRLTEMMRRDEFDLIGIGRIILANPDWAQLVRAGCFNELRSYSPQRTGEFIEPSE